jgi:hypothetical protein
MRSFLEFIANEKIEKYDGVYADVYRLVIKDL